MSKIILKCHIYKRFFSALPKPATTNVRPKRSSEEEKKVCTKIDNDHLFGKKHTIRNLQQLLGISAFDALGIANSTKTLSLVNGKMMSKNFEILKKAGVRNDVILKYPTLLAMNDVMRKLNVCKQISDDVNEVAPLLTLKIQELENMAVKDMRRTQNLSELLQMPKANVCEALGKKGFLRTISFDKVKANVKLLLANGIPIEDIHKDLWALSYNTEVIGGRLEKVKAMRVEQIKTWMVRCQPEVLDRYVARRTDKKQILGDNSIAEYLSERLECSVDEAKVLMHKHPALQNKSMKKMKEILDFLFAQGFKPSQICRVPKILLHSVETTKKRLKELEPSGKHLDSLYMLTKSKKQYMQHLEALIKTSGKAKSN